MKDLVGVTFNKGNKIYYFLANGYKLKKNTTVIVETERGLQFGKIEIPLINYYEKDFKKPLNRIIRISSKKDYLQNKKNLNDSKRAIEVCKKLTIKYDLDMKIIDADYTFDRSQLLFYFLSDTRIDFRELAKELARIYKTRIELRQIGVRDKAKQIGGVGQCGREICCSLFLNNLDNVSINMVKNQNLTLNPSKINGACGRLLCCLRYEDETYSNCRNCLPKLGDIIEVNDLKGKVISLNLLEKKYKVELESGEIIEMEHQANGCC